MPSLTGRAVSAAIHRRLREALARGEPLTYAQLAQTAGCTVRSVRNYLSRAEEIFGFSVQRSRNGGHSIVVRAVGLESPQDPSQSPLDALGDALLSAWFPQRSPAPQPDESVIVALRGIPAYSRNQTKALESWLLACRKDPRQALRVRASSAPHELALWPLGTIVHNTDGVLLAGLPLDADTPDAIRIVDLGLVEASEFEPIALSESGDPPSDLSTLDLGRLLDLPFSARPRTIDSKAAMVHVRFSPESTPGMLSRVWHPTQRVVLRRKGSMELRFGPVDLDTAAGWASSLGRAIRILGDKKLRRAVKRRDFAP